MVLLCALAWSQVVDVDVVEPLNVGDVRVSPSLTALLMADSNPGWQPEAAQAAAVRGLHPELGVFLDVPDTAVTAMLSGIFLDVIGDRAWPLEPWVFADAFAQVDLFRRSPVGVRAVYIGRVRSGGGARDVLTDAPSGVNGIEVAVPVRTSDKVELVVGGQLRSSSYQFWGSDGRVQPYNYSDMVGATAEAVVSVSDSIQLGAGLTVQHHGWGASSLDLSGFDASDPAAVLLFDALRPVGQVTADMSCGSWTLNTGLGWDGTQISAVQGQAPRLATEDRLIGEVVLTGESAASSVSLSFERFNDRPFVAHLSVVFAGEVAVETEVASFVRLGTVSGVRTDEMVADDPWRTTRLHGSVYGAVDLSPNLVSTVRFDGSWRDLDPFDRLPVSRVAATVGLTGKI